jgi:hypothetical protein
MTNGQAFAALIAIKRANPEHSESIEAVMNYIGELAYVAGLASGNLSIAARKLADDQIIPHNAGIAARKLDALIAPRPSHGGDL